MSNQAVGTGSDGISDDALAASLVNSGLKQKVGLSFNCTDLPNLDKRSKTDAFIVIW